jgi:hypothetical protein
MVLTLDPTIKITDIITSLSVVCALCTLIYTWTKDRNLRSKEYADRIRAAAASTLARVDRCQSLLLSLGEAVQPAITEIDGLMVQHGDSVACRDKLWKVLYELHTAIAIKFSDEEIELAYAPLLAFRKDIYGLFKDALHSAKVADSIAFNFLQELLQVAVLRTDAKTARSAELGNILRTVCSIYSHILSEHLDAAFDEIRSFLRKTIEAPDRVVLLPDRREPLVDGKGPRFDVGYWTAKWASEKEKFEFIVREAADVAEGGREAMPTRFDDIVAKLFAAADAGDAVYADHFCRPSPNYMLARALRMRAVNLDSRR